MSEDRTWKQHVEAVSRLRTARGRAAEGCFSIEGYRLVERALLYGAEIIDVIVAASLRVSPNRRAAALFAQLDEAGVPIFSVPDVVIEDMIQGRTFGPLLARVEALPPAGLSDWLDEPSWPCKLMVLCGMADPGNIGALMRTALASGVDAMICVEGTEPFHPKAMRTSMGAVFSLPLLHIQDGKSLLDALQKSGIQSIGAVVQNGVAPPVTKTIEPRHALWIGSESHGIPAEIEKALDVRWSIPMLAEMDSFSVNAATAVLLYETNRSRWINTESSKDA